jgi:hypothetical protein
MLYWTVRVAEAPWGVCCFDPRSHPVDFGARGFPIIKPHPTLVAPTTENRTVMPLRRPNAELRTRDHLTADEVEALMAAARGNRYGPAGLPPWATRSAHPDFSVSCRTSAPAIGRR